MELRYLRDPGGRLMNVMHRLRFCRGRCTPALSRSLRQLFFRLAMGSRCALPWCLFVFFVQVASRHGMSACSSVRLDPFLSTEAGEIPGAGCDCEDACCRSGQGAGSFFLL
jgi:hypothetical protein